MSQDHAHEALLYKTIQTEHGVRVVETCSCGWQRYSERGPRHVEWSPWQAPAREGK
jgi:hypothetical protein